MAEERQGFLGRWARRKTDVLQGKALEEPAAVEKPAPVAEPAASPAPVKTAPAVASSSATQPAEQPEKMLSLDDVKRLTRDSDFTPFMARNVGPDVRNAAMKKLFTDPHYNVMDGLDIYIDDYSRSDPIPQAMLRQMVGAKLLKIFDDEEDQASKEGAATQPPAESLPLVNLNSPTPQTMAQSADSPDSPKPLSPEPSSQAAPIDGSGTSQHDHAHSHLRLQPDHAPPAPDAGHGTS
jgi:hypothetical protein